MRVVFLLQFVEVVQFGLVKPLEHRALVGSGRPSARQLIKVEGIQLELHGIANGLEAHGVAHIALRDYFQVAAAHEALAVRDGEPAGEFEAALATPGVTHLGATDFVFFQNAAALGTRGWHTYKLPTLVPVIRAPTRILFPLC
jgi:hypothetical protein